MQLSAISTVKYLFYELRKIRQSEFGKVNSPLSLTVVPRANADVCAFLLNAVCLLNVSLTVRGETP